jgi:hypothetical protein
MVLQNTWEVIAGINELVRRNRKAEWNPKSVVYVNWKTVKLIQRRYVYGLWGTPYVLRKLHAARLGWCGHACCRFPMRGANELV